ncbi:helix-turn-helix domain-containing protein [Chitinophaga lutea]
MAAQHILPTIRIRDICQLPAQDDFSLFRHEQEGKALLSQPHKHDFYLLLFVEKGGGTHTIDFSSYRVRPRQVHFLAAGQAHSWALGKHTTGYQLAFGKDFLPDEALRRSFFSFAATPVLDLDEAQFSGAQQELRAFEREAPARDPYTRRLAALRLELLLTLLERYYAGAHPSAGQTAVGRMVKSFLTLLESQYKEHAMVEHYAALLHVTPQYLNIVCRKETGYTAGQLIRRRLLLEARRLLTFSDQDSKEIAYDLGFSDSSYFSRFFRRYTGMSPMEFRQDIQKVPSSAR